MKENTVKNDKDSKEGKKERKPESRIRDESVTNKNPY